MIAERFGIPLFLIPIFSFLSWQGQAQEIKALEGSFGVDTINKIIVWHHTDFDSFELPKNGLQSFFFDQKYDVNGTPVSLSYLQPLKLRGKNDSYTLYISKLPIVHLTIATEIKDDVKSLGYYTYFNDEKYLKGAIGVEHRGNLSLTFPKKSYDLEFWSDSTSKKSKDIKFKGLRNDDDWILDGLYNEPLRIRSTLAAKLWLEIHKPDYLMSEPKAKSGFDVQYVEVFKNNAYIGIYALSEAIDRKQLALKKSDGNRIQGELFKASSYEGAPAFKKAPAYDNLFPHWGGFEMKFPLLNSRANWENLAQLVELVVNGSDAQFSSKIGELIHLNNGIDYFLFVNLLRATDNLGKNYYLARYDRSSPYFFVPWDLDGVFGTIQEGRRIATTDDILSNGLFDRLLRLNPNGFKKKLHTRWTRLRQSQFSDDHLFDELEKIYSTLTRERIYEREKLVWPRGNVAEDDYSYLKTWLKDRLAYLDTYFDNL